MSDWTITIRPELVPVFAVGRATVLDGGLSTTARLLYVLMLAAVAMDNAPDVAGLLGLSEDGLAPFLDELAGAGVAEVDRSGPDVVVAIHELART